MKIGVPVGDVMNRNYVAIKPFTPLFDCAKLMIKKRVPALVIEEDKKLKGVITEHDIIWAITKKSVAELTNIKASDVVPRKTTTIKPNADLSAAIKKIRGSRQGLLPVTSKKNVLGVITAKDILRIEPGLFDMAAAYTSKLRQGFDILKFRKGDSDGICEECGNQDSLHKVDGRLICGSCRDKM